MPRPRLDQNFLRYRSKGDVKALAAAFDQAAPELQRIARRLASGDDALADDAVQATFLTAIEKAREFRARERLLPWLLGILSVQLRRERASAARLPNPDWLKEDAALRSSGDPERAAQDLELRALVEDKVATLPDTYREAVEAHLFSATTSGETATRLGVTAAALHVRVHRGLGLLRAALPAGAALSAGLALPSPRGLDGIRREVLGSTQVASATGAVAASTPGLALAAASLGGLLAGGLGTLAYVASGPGDAETSLAAHSPEARAAQAARSEVALDRLRSTELGETFARLADPRRDLSASLSVVADPAIPPSPESRDDDFHRSVPSWKEVFQKTRGYNEFLVLGQRVANLPGETGLDVIRAVYPSLTTFQKLQVGKPFAFLPGGPGYELEVIHLLATDEAPRVRGAAWSLLRAIAFRDFSKDPSSYDSWRGRTRGMPLADVYEAGARDFASLLVGAPDDELMSVFASATPPNLRRTSAAGISLKGPLTAGGLTAGLPGWLSHDDPAVVRAALGWLPHAGVPGAVVRASLLPLLGSDHEGIARDALVALTLCDHPFVVDELRYRFEGEANPRPTDARRIDFWRDWALYAR